MPAYNAAGTVCAAITSVLAQTDGDFELILVDDGSSDSTFEGACRFAQGDRRFQAVSQANRGPAEARNHGIALARGIYVAFLDADDRWARDALAVHRKRFSEDPKLGISFGRVRFFDPAMMKAGRISARRKQIRLADALGENPLCTTSNLAARRTVFDVVGGFDTALRHAEDQEWLVRVLATTDWTAAGVDAVLVDYRTSPSGLSADLKSMQAGWERMIACAAAYAPMAVERERKYAAALFDRYLARRALRTGHSAAEAAAYFACAWRADGLRLLLADPVRTILTAAGVAAANLLPSASRAIVSR
jgi:glycosyltransferase involved in cell wall biosynthesis